MSSDPEATFAISMTVEGELRVTSIGCNIKKKKFHTSRSLYGSRVGHLPFCVNVQVSANTAVSQCRHNRACRLFLSDSADSIGVSVM
jgi:hypothetical protein